MIFDLKKRGERKPLLAERRRFLKAMGQVAGLSLAAAGGIISAREFLTRREKSFRKEWYSSDWLVDDPALLDQYSRDYGNLLVQRPFIVVFPESAKDVCELVLYANEHGIPLNCRGVGHACNGQSLLGGGIILDFKPAMNRMRMVGEVAEMEPGITWLAAQKQAIANGRGFPVLPDFLGITVGGNLAIGGGGTRSIHFRSESDHVRELEVVTGEGKLLRCSRSEASELFYFTPFSLGQLAIMTRVWMDTIPYRPRTMFADILLKSYPAFSRLLHHLAAELNEIPYDLIYGFRPEKAFTYLVRLGKDDQGKAKELAEFKSWAKSLATEVNFHTVQDYELYDHSWTEVLPRTTPRHYHVWVDFLPPPDLFLEVCQAIYDEIATTYHDLDRFLGIYPVGVSLDMARDFPLAPFPRNRGKRGMSTNLYFTIPPEQTRYAEQAKELIAKLIDRFLPRGMGLYMYGWFRLSAEQKRMMWGKALDDYFAVKKKTDPNNIINPLGVINCMI